jgi:SpoVK/Ycf46/Vps4 family AAA+-type ATPase
LQTSSTFSVNPGELLETLGVNFGHSNDLEKASAAQIRKAIYRRLAQVEAEGPSLRGTVLDLNSSVIAEHIKLNDVERQVLCFIVLLNTVRNFDDFLCIFGPMDYTRAVHIIAGILDVPMAKVKAALSPEGTLLCSGLLRVDRRENYTLKGKVEVLRGAQDDLLNDTFSIERLFNRFFSLNRGSSLGAADYAHVHADHALITDYLDVVRKERRHGVNILIHGRPGTGKTEFVRMIAKEMGFELYEVSMKDEDGDALTPSDRFSAYRLSQRLLSRNSKALILFDEIEDVFPSDDDFDQRDKKSVMHRKAWVNRALEDNPVPAFWISNEISHIDPAFLRRFDYVMDLRTPSKASRKRILKSCLGEVGVSEAWVDQISEIKDLAPAIIHRAVKVASSIQGPDVRIIEQNMERLLGNTLEAMGYTRPNKSVNSLPESYGLEFVNADCDLFQVLEGLKQNGSGRLCLYGPPGTGKSAFGRYVAETLDRPFVLKRASDILGPYVGQTEQNVAKAFREAAEENAVLMLDEADSFLQSRRNAVRTWEISQVNELLVQMESFHGVLIAATNDFDSLDQASMRRFDEKVKLDYLTPPQSWGLFRRMMAGRQGWDEARAGELQGKLHRLNRLTPGDFMAAFRQMQLHSNDGGAEAFLAALARGLQTKEQGKARPIGFVH